MTGMGIDIVDVRRIRQMLERHGERFLQRCFQPAEIRVIQQGDAPAEAAAANWAAKEALLKALGAPIRHVPYKNVEVLRSAEVGVELHLHGRARELWRAMGAGALHLSLSSTDEQAAALVVLD